MPVSSTTCSYPMVSSVSIECGVISGEVIMFSYHGGNVSTVTCGDVEIRSGSTATVLD